MEFPVPILGKRLLELADFRHSWGLETRQSAPVFRDFPVNSRRSGNCGGGDWFAQNCQHHQFRETCRSEEHTSELQSLMRISYAGFCLKKKETQTKCKII